MKLWQLRNSKIVKVGILLYTCSLPHKAKGLCTAIKHYSYRMALKRKTHQRDCLFQTHFSIIGTTYQCDAVLDRQHGHFQNCYIFMALVVAPAVAPHMLHWRSHRLSPWCVDSHTMVASVVASHVKCLIMLSLALVYFAI